MSRSHSIPGPLAHPSDQCARIATRGSWMTGREKEQQERCTVPAWRDVDSAALGRAVCRLQVSCKPLLMKS